MHVSHCCLPLALIYGRIASFKKNPADGTVDAHAPRKYRHAPLQKRQRSLADLASHSNTLVAQHVTADDQPHHLVGAFEDLVHPHVAQHALDRMVAQIAVTAMELQAAVHRIDSDI